MDKNYMIAAYLYCKTGWKPDDIKGEYLTHINYSFALVRDGVISAAELDKLDEIKLVKKRFPHLKVLISVGGWGADGFSDAALTDESRSLFARSAVEFMRSNGFDGIDIDWEYPTSSDGGIKSRPEDRENLNLLLEALRRELDRCGAGDGKRYMLTAAIGSTAYTLRFYDLKHISGILDYVNLMTYDFAHGSSAETGHHTCLFSPKGKEDAPSADAAVKICLDKGCLRASCTRCAFYGRGWDVTDRSSNGLYVPVASSAGFMVTGTCGRFIGRDGFKDTGMTGRRRRIFGTGSILTYDDRIAGARFLCQINGLGGIMFWELSQDNGDELLKAIYSKFV